MKSVSLAFLSLALVSSAAFAAMPVRVIIAEQVADAPSQQDEQNSDKNATGPTESPSKKLSQSKGVIHPPPTGDHSVVKPPGNATGKVIPPPGTPGGDQNVQPK